MTENTNLTITGKNITLTDGLKENVKERIKKIEKLVGEDAAIEVVLSARGKQHRAEVTVKFNRNVVRAEVTETDLYKAILDAVDTVASRIKKVKGKNRDKNGRQSIRENMEEEVTALEQDILEELFSDAEISREKLMEAASMSRNEAIRDMEYTDHDFYAFRDKDKNDAVTIAYRRNNGSYGMLVIAK